jgi:hypothetical protein
MLWIEMFVFPHIKFPGGNLTPTWRYELVVSRSW